MSKYKIINETNLSNEEVGLLIDLYISKNLTYKFNEREVYSISFEYNRKKYCITCKNGIIFDTFIIKEGNRNA